jgi:hypothetical protein
MLHFLEDFTLLDYDKSIMLLFEEDRENKNEDAPTLVPKSKIEILSQEIDDEEGLYRVRAGHKVHYLTIPTTVFDEDTMCRPYLLIPQLPGFPSTDWSAMRIFRGAEGCLESNISYGPLPAIHGTWHPQRIDVLSLRETKHHRSNVHEVLYERRPAISKIACFKWHMPRMEVETWAYSLINQHHQQSLSEYPLSPRIFGHLPENGRVIRLLLERVDG